MTSKKAKRTLAEPGIYDPNYSQDPQYGNVSTLPDGVKRVHTFFRDKPDADDYYRLQIIFPECPAPRIDSSKLSEVEEMDVPIIKNVQVVFSEESNLDKSVKANILVGIFEKDQLSLGPFPPIIEGAQDQTLDLHNHEAVFLLNDPIVYYFFDGDRVICSNNIPNPKRGWICLQNYVNLFVSVHGVQTDKYLSFNVYLDYTWCKMKYKDALIWKADFEKNIQFNKKYRLYHSADRTLIISRGNTGGMHEGSDPSKFPPFVNNKDVYKIPERSLAGAISPREVLWGETLKKYLK